jgi:predicted Zn-dependent protease
MMTKPGLPIGLVSLLAVVAACAVNPATGRREVSLMSEAQEISIGQESDAQVREEMGVYDDPELQRYISDLGLRMAKMSERPNLPWRFTVVDDPAINAFAIPGGFIYVTRGILPFFADEAELAGVLGHEIGHVTARHSAQQYTRTVGGAIGLTALGIFVPAARPFGGLTEQALGVLFLKYGREDELQADELGVRYTSAGGWDPEAVPSVLATLGRLDEAAGDRDGVPNWLSTHPEPLSRVKEVQAFVQQAKAVRTGFRRDPEALLSRIDGIIWGDNPKQGIIRGNAFLHPDLRLRIDFPSGWEIRNSPQQVAAKAPGADVFLILQAVQKPQGRDIEEIALNNMQSAGFRASQGQRSTINGLDAFVGTYQGQIEGLGNVTVRAGHIAHNRQVYLVAGLVAPEAFQQADSAFLASIRSFRALSAAEAEGIHPNRVDRYVVREGDTWQSIAERSGGLIKPTTLAIMNNSAPDSRPQVGGRIKIVVSG